MDDKEPQSEYEFYKRQYEALKKKEEQRIHDAATQPPSAPSVEEDRFKQAHKAATRIAATIEDGHYQSALFGYNEGRSSAEAASTTQGAVPDGQKVYIACAYTDPQQCGDYTSADGKNRVLCPRSNHTRCKGRDVWVRASKRLPSNAHGVVKIKIEGIEKEGVWSEKDNAFIAGNYRYPPTMYYIEWLDETGSQRQQVGPVWVYGKKIPEVEDAYYVEYYSGRKGIIRFRPDNSEMRAWWISHVKRYLDEPVTISNDIMAILQQINISDIDAPVFTHSHKFKEHFDYIKGKFIEIIGEAAFTPSKESDAVAFAKWLAENTEIVRENEITLYRYCDKMNEWGNYILDDIYQVYKEQ